MQESVQIHVLKPSCIVFRIRKPPHGKDGLWNSVKLPLNQYVNNPMSPFSLLCLWILLKPLFIWGKLNFLHWNRGGQQLHCGLYYVWSIFLKCHTIFEQAVSISFARLAVLICRDLANKRINSKKKHTFWAP